MRPRGATTQLLARETACELEAVLAAGPADVEAAGHRSVSARIASRERARRPSCTSRLAGGRCLALRLDGDRGSGREHIADRRADRPALARDRLALLRRPWLQPQVADRGRFLDASASPAGGTPATVGDVAIHQQLEIGLLIVRSACGARPERGLKELHQRQRDGGSIGEVQAAAVVVEGERIARLCRKVTRFDVFMSEVTV